MGQVARRSGLAASTGRAIDPRSLERWSAGRRKPALRQMLRYLQQWIDQLRWQRLKPFQKLAWTSFDHLEGILDCCRTKVPSRVVEAVNGNLEALMRCGRGDTDLRYLLLKARRMAVMKTEFVVVAKAA